MWESTLYAKLKVRRRAPLWERICDVTVNRVDRDLESTEKLVLHKIHIYNKSDSEIFNKSEQRFDPSQCRLPSSWTLGCVGLAPSSGHSQSTSEDDTQHRVCLQCSPEDTTERSHVPDGLQMFAGSKSKAGKQAQGV